MNRTVGVKLRKPEKGTFLASLSDGEDGAPGDLERVPHCEHGSEGETTLGTQDPCAPPTWEARGEHVGPSLVALRLLVWTSVPEHGTSWVQEDEEPWFPSLLRELARREL